MRRTIAALAAAALLTAATPALAGGTHYRYGHHHGHHHGHGLIIVGALAGGLLLGHLLTRPAYYPPRPVYYQPRPVYVAPPAPAITHCRPTTGTSITPDGRRAEYGGTMCYDTYGRAHILPQSVHFRGYLR